MTHATNLQDSSEDLEALFDNIVKSEPQAATNESLHSAVPATHGAGDSAMDKVLSRVGHLTRILHDNLREISYDKLIEKAAEAIPDARDRLNYIATMTEQAALRVLNATDVAQPIQDKLAADAKGLSTLWQKLYDRQPNLTSSRAWSPAPRLPDDVSAQAGAINAQLMEIMMAQDLRSDRPGDQEDHRYEQSMQEWCNCCSIISCPRKGRIRPPQPAEWPGCKPKDAPMSSPARTGG